MSQPAPLLPSGLRDLLPPEAEALHRMSAQLLRRFAAFGYALVSPPLAEYAAAFLEEGGAALAQNTFRVMDPLANQLLAIRSDMTMQVARIAGRLMAHQPLPLRLCYAGNVLRMQPDGLNPARQIAQAGIERIGADDASALYEVLLTLSTALHTVVKGPLLCDLSSGGALHQLVPSPLNDTTREALLRAIGAKDASALPDIAAAPALALLLAAAGPCEHAAETLAASRASQKTRTQAESVLAPLLAMAGPLAHIPGLRVSVDALESAGFDYYAGPRFSLFSASLRQEVARGGAYALNRPHAPPCPALGGTVFVSRLGIDGKKIKKHSILLFNQQVPHEAVIAAQKQGYITIYHDAKGESSLKKSAKAQHAAGYLTENSINLLKDGE